MSASMTAESVRRSTASSTGGRMASVLEPRGATGGAPAADGPEAASGGAVECFPYAAVATAACDGANGMLQRITSKPTLVRASAWRRECSAVRPLLCCTDSPCACSGRALWTGEVSEPEDDDMARGWRKAKPRPNPREFVLAVCASSSEPAEFHLFSSVPQKHLLPNSFPNSFRLFSFLGLTKVTSGRLVCADLLEFWYKKPLPPHRARRSNVSFLAYGIRSVCDCARCMVRGPERGRGRLKNNPPLGRPAIN